MPRPVVGVVWSVQVAPFQLAAIGASVEPLAWPAAMQKVVVGQDTPLKTFPKKPVSLGLGTTLQVDPFHCSTSVLSPVPPTAIHIVAVAQLTASRKAVPVWEAPVTVVHDEPFHCSMSVSVCAFTTWSPTPRQKVALAQETP